MKSWIIVAAVVVVVVIGWLAAGWVRSGEPVETAQVRRDLIRRYVDERGTTRLPRVHLITMPFDGRVKRISLVEREPVKKGDPVAQIVPSDLENAVTEARAVVQRLEAAILENDDTTVEQTTKLQSISFVDSMKHTVAAAKSRMTSGKRRLDYAETFLADTRTLAQTGSKTKDDVDRADVSYVESQVGYQQDVLIWRAMEAIFAATQKLPELVAQYTTRKTLTSAVLEREKAEAEARLRQVETRQRRGTMTSPVDGVVLERPVSNERHLTAGTILLRIGQLDLLEVEADVLSQDVVDVKPGQPVDIYGPAVGGGLQSAARGVVDRIFPAGFTKISSLGVEQQRVKVIVRFDDGVLDKLRKALDVGVDYRVRVRIYTAQEAGALVVPRSALFRGAAGQWQVFAVRDGRARLTPVKIGLSNDRTVQIVEGLDDGDEVILAPETSLTDSSKVKAIARR